MAQLTRAQLTDTINELTAQLEAYNTQTATLAALQETVAQQGEQLTLAQARAAEAEAQAAAAEAQVQAQATAAAAAAAQAQAQAQAAAAAAQAQAQAQAAATTANAQVQAQGQAAAAAAPPPLELIPQPKGGRYNIRNAMCLSDHEFLMIRATIHNLVKSTQLNWREDFRHQDAGQMAILFKAARKEHPVLKRYVANWATAAIARTYMQNMRKHACKQGYIPAWEPRNAANANGNGTN